MFLYNVTIIVDKDSHQAIRAQIEHQISSYQDPHVRLLELLNSPHEGVTYCINLQAASEETISQFQRSCLRQLKELADKDYHGKVLFFDSTMKYLTKF